MLQALDTSHTVQLNKPKPANHADLQKVAKEYEATFIGTMLQQMYTDMPTDGPFGGGHAEETWRPMLINEYAKKLTDQGGVGLADHIYDTLLKIQEG